MWTTIQICFVFFFLFCELECERAVARRVYQPIDMMQNHVCVCVLCIYEMPCHSKLKDNARLYYSFDSAFLSPISKHELSQIRIFFTASYSLDCPMSVSFCWFVLSTINPCDISIFLFLSLDSNRFQLSYNSFRVPFWLKQLMSEQIFVSKCFKLFRLREAINYRILAYKNSLT